MVGSVNKMFACVMVRFAFCSARCTVMDRRNDGQKEQNLMKYVTGGVNLKHLQFGTFLCAQSGEFELVGRQEAEAKSRER